jgi:hypothetical protein
MSGVNYVHADAINYFNDYFFSDVEQMNYLKDYNMSYGRFRIESLICYSFDYGIYSSMIGLFLLYVYKKNNNRLYLYLSITGGLGGCIFCGSRTALIAGFLGYLIYYLFSADKKIKAVTLLVIAVISILYILSSSNTVIMQSVVDLFTTGGQNSGGSSIDLRQSQLLASLYFFNSHPMFGNGIDYLSSINTYNVMKQSMMGSESMIYSILINEGLFGIIYTFSFFISLIIKFYKRRKYGIVKLGLPLIISFLFFSLGTGIQGAWLIFMPMMAYVLYKIKLIENGFVDNSRKFQYD